MATSTATARLLQQAFEPAADLPDTDPMGERILDAALHLVAAAGVRNLTMDDVAARAGVGRMTVYRRFGNRQTLIDALALREARRCLAEIAGSIHPTDPLDERVASVFLTTLRVIGAHPLLQRLARVEPEALLRELTRNDSEVFGLVRDFLVAQIRAAQTRGELRAGDPEPLAELIIRLAASFVLIPGGVFATRTEAAIRATLHTLVATTQLP